MILKPGMDHQGLNIHKVYINGDPGLTLTLLTARSKLVELLILLIPDQTSGADLKDHWSSRLKMVC